MKLPIHCLLTCNFTPQFDNNFALLNSDEVITLFHEFGHGLHHLLTEINDYGVLAFKVLNGML